MQKEKLHFSVVLAICFSLALFWGCESTSGFNPGLDDIGFKDGESFQRADDSSLDRDKRENLQTVAEKLAVRFVNERSPKKTEIPSDIVNFFYNGLVYLDKSDLEEATQVTDEFTLQAADPANPRQVLIWADKSKEWVDNWRSDSTNTGVEAIDELIETFDLELIRFREFDSSPEVTATMQAPGPINGYAVGKQFASLDEINKASPDGMLTGGRDVKANIKANYLVLDVTVGYGDCPAGCINKINHKFKVFSDGKVTLTK